MQYPRNTLFLPRWYPSQNDMQNGVFIQKHARAAAMKNKVVVLYAIATNGESRITDSNYGNLREVIIYYAAGHISLLNFITSVKALFAIWRYVRRSGFQPDVCHLNVSGRQSLLALWINRKYSVPFIISEHWSGFISGQYEMQSFLKRLFTAYVFRKAALVTVVSETLKRAIINCGLRKDIKLLPNVVNVQPDAWKLHPVNAKFRFLAVADLKDEIKNISGIIRAFSEVHKNEPTAELMIVGEGKDRGMLESLVRNLKLEAACHFTGIKSNDEVLKIIPTAHVIIVNSRIETFSVITLEAIFSGRPVIATRCGGPEQFINERNGILIEKDNPDELKNAMLSIKKNYSKYSPHQVKESVPACYDMESIGRLLDGYYEEVLTGPIKAR